MLPYWDSVLRPLLAVLNDEPLVEIGAAKGETTEKLAQLAAERSDTVLHSIDPAPEFDPAPIEQRLGASRFCLHRARSHDVLDEIGPPAAVLIDGDHNWYTVHGELTRLWRICAQAGRSFPLVLLHDVEWPYARRDMYYEPDAIPAQWRRPWARRGIRWGRTQLDETGRGVNSHLANAIEEGGPRNGVLTAVEDFVSAADRPLELQIVRGRAGLGVLASRELLERSPRLRREWDRLRSERFRLAQLERLAADAARATAARLEASAEVTRLRLAVREAEERAPAARVG